jgi:hypothetical protein
VVLAGSLFEQILNRVMAEVVFAIGFFFGGSRKDNGSTVILVFS